MSIQNIQDEIVDEFSFLENWEERYEYMIDLGKSLPLIDSKYKKEENLIKGCQSKVWLYAEYKDDKIFFTADSDAIITKGIAAILVRAYSGHSPEEILAADTNFINKIGLKEHLSTTRANGLVSMVEQIKRYAVAYQLKNN